MGLRLFRRHDGSGSDWQAGITGNISLNWLTNDYALRTAEKLPATIKTDLLIEQLRPKTQKKALIRRNGEKKEPPHGYQGPFSTFIPSSTSIQLQKLLLPQVYELCGLCDPRQAAASPLSGDQYQGQQLPNERLQGKKQRRMTTCRGMDRPGIGVLGLLSICLSFLQLAYTDKWNSSAARNLREDSIPFIYSPEISLYFSQFYKIR